MKKKILGVIAIIVVIAALLGMYYAFREQPEPTNMGPSSDESTVFDAKDVIIEVTNSEGKSTRYEITTHAEYLQGVMDEAEGLEYETSDGMVMVVGGERANYVQDGAYWAFYVNGEYCSYGISDQPVNDGDEFSIVYTKA